MQKAVQWGRDRVTRAENEYQGYRLDSYDADSGNARIVSPRLDAQGNHETYDVNVKTGYSTDPDSQGHLTRINQQLADAGIKNKVVSKHVQIARRLIEAQGDARPEPVGDILFQGGKDDLSRARGNEAQTISPEFKNWFGDWQEDPAGASKVVDENGEPLVMYHGTPKPGYSRFILGRDSNLGLFGDGFYFTDSPEIASEYAENRGSSGGDTPATYPVYLDIKKPFEMEASYPRKQAERLIRSAVSKSDTPPGYRGEEVSKAAVKKVMEEALQDFAKNSDTVRGEDIWNTLRDIGARFTVGTYQQKAVGNGYATGALKAMGHDGIAHEGGGRYSKYDTRRHQVYIAFRDNQIKSATGNRGTFDPNNADILFQGGKEAKQPQPTPPANPPTRVQDSGEPGRAPAAGQFIIDPDTRRKVTVDEVLPTGEVRVIDSEGGRHTVPGDQWVERRDEYESDPFAARQGEAEANPALAQGLARENVASATAPGITNRAQRDYQRQQRAQATREAVAQAAAGANLPGGGVGGSQGQGQQQDKQRGQGKPPEPLIDLGLTPEENKAPVQTRFDKVASLWKAGLLTGPATHFRNITGNSAFQVAEEVARVPAALVDMTRVAAAQALHKEGKWGGNRQVLGMDLLAIGRASRQGTMRGFREAAEILKQGKVTSSPDPFEKGSALDKLGVTQEFVSKSRVLNGYVNGVFRFLSAEDRVFKMYALSRSLEEQANVVARAEARDLQRAKQAVPKGYIDTRARELAATPSEAMVAQAVADAEYSTFNNDNKLSGAIGDFRHSLKTRFGEGAGLATNIVLPFDKTPTNVLGRVLEYAGGVGMAPSRLIARKIAGQAFTEQEQRRFAQTFGRGSVGLGLIVLGYKLADKGIATGANAPGPADYKKREREGKPEGSIYADGRWWNISKIGPLGNLITLGATIRERQEGMGGGVGGTLRSTVFSAGSQLKDLPLFSAGETYGDAMTAANAKGQDRFIGNLIGTPIPAALAAVAGQIDSTKRDTSGVLGPAQNKIPGLRQMLPAKEGNPPQPNALFDPFNSIPGTTNGSPTEFGVKKERSSSSRGGGASSPLLKPPAGLGSGINSKQPSVLNLLGKKPKRL